MSVLEDIYTFWFDPTNSKKVWFNATPEDDEIIRTKFGEILENPPKITCDTTHNESIGYIILFDQLSRHINRGSNEIIEKHLEKILIFAMEFYATNKKKITSKEFPFVLLPLRHTKRYDLFLFVVNETWKKIKESESESETETETDSDDYIRFIKATYERYAISAIDMDFDNVICHEPVFIKNILSENIKKVLDKKSPFGEIKISMDIFEKTITKQILCDLSFLNKDKTYILSLSGGVDSMVLSYYLKINNIKFVAVHISYENRPECLEEIKFLKEWCNILNVKLYYRRIIEINRLDSMEFGLRQTYEDYTKEIRFNTYKIVGKIIENTPSVFLGHNKDDRFENILTNIASQSHYDNLSGMETIQEISSIEFIRPFLNTPKKDIYEYAKKDNISHLATSTPDWSQRGKIRDKVKPTLIEWNPVMIDSLFKLSSELGSYIKFIENSAQIVVDELKKTKQIIMNIKNVPTIEAFWTHVFHENGIWISTKSNQNFIVKLDFIKQKFQQFDLNKLEKLNLNKSTQVMWKKINMEEIMILF